MRDADRLLRRRVQGAETVDFFSDASLAGFAAGFCDPAGTLDARLAGDVWQAKGARVLSA